MRCFSPGIQSVGCHRFLPRRTVGRRIIYRAGPYGGAAKQRQERVDGGYPMTGPDEGLLMGVRNVEPVNGGGDWTITRPDHWMFEGTGMKRGDSIPVWSAGNIGNPADIRDCKSSPKASRSAERDPSSGRHPFTWTEEQLVFNAATIFWAQG